MMTSELETARETAWANYRLLADKAQQAYEQWARASKAFDEQKFKDDNEQRIREQIMQEFMDEQAIHNEEKP